VKFVTGVENIYTVFFLFLSRRVWFSEYISFCSCFGKSVVCRFFSFRRTAVCESCFISEACEQKYSSAAVRVVGD